MITKNTPVCVSTDNGEAYGRVVENKRNPMGYPIVVVEFRSLDPTSPNFPSRREEFAERDVSRVEG